MARAEFCLLTIISSSRGEALITKDKAEVTESIWDWKKKKWLKKKKMDEEQVVKFVETYLKKKGFKQAELAFHDEVQHNSNANSVDIHSDPDLSLLLLSLSQ